jgi:hypothetical protein
LDALVAENVYGCKVAWAPIKDEPYCVCGISPDIISGDSPHNEISEYLIHYSTDMLAGMSLILHLRSLGYDVGVWLSDGLALAQAFPEGNKSRCFLATAKTIPHAACLVALQALGAIPPEEGTGLKELDGV